METTDISKNVSFTGHRSGRISQPMLTLFAGMVTEIKSLYASGCRNFFSGMAEGGDLVFAKAVLVARNELTDIRLVAAIPFREQSARYSDMNKRLYISLLEEADKTVVLSESYHKGCFHRRNDFLVEHAATMLAYWDGQPYGGTYYTVKKVSKQVRKSLISINGIIMKRYSKTVAQQCKYYEVDNIFVYMVETYQNGNITVFEKLFRELCKEARKDFIDFLLSEVEPIYWREILKIMV